MRTEENERMTKCFKDAILEKKNEKKENRCLMRRKKKWTLRKRYRK